MRSGRSLTIARELNDSNRQTELYTCPTDSNLSTCLTDFSGDHMRIGDTVAEFCLLVNERVPHIVAFAHLRSVDSLRFLLTV
jgi:hypothetical protein